LECGSVLLAGVMTEILRINYRVIECGMSLKYD
jgi:hypothetical protein